MLITHFRDSIQEQMVVVRARNYSRRRGWRSSNWGSDGKVEYGHDDVIMAAMIGWISRVQWPPPPHLMARKTAGPNTSGIVLERPGPAPTEGILDMRGQGQLLEAHQHKILRPVVKQLPRAGRIGYL